MSKKIPKKTEQQKEAEESFKVIQQAYQDFMNADHSKIILEDLFRSAGILRHIPAGDEKDLWKREGVREFLFNNLLNKCSITEEMVQQMIMKRVTNKLR